MVRTQEPTIAVIIPNRNDSKYLHVCLDSVVNQADWIDQIIVVDDNSTDNSVQIIRDRLSTIPQAQIIENPACLGTMGALNVGLSKTNCDYAMFLASNDYAISGVFERAKRCITRTGSPGVWSAMVWTVDEQGKPLHLYPSAVVALKDKYFSPTDCVRLALSIGNWFTGTTLIYHRQTLLQIGGFDTNYQGWADYLAALTIASLKGACFTPEPLGVMRRHAGGYLWRTITDPQRVAAILARIKSTGPTLSPALFSSFFCERLTHRFWHSCFNALDNDTWIGAIAPENGLRYRVLRVLAPFAGQSRLMRYLMTFVLLKPFDLPSIIRYKVLGLMWARMQGWRIRKMNDVG